MDSIEEILGLGIIIDILNRSLKPSFANIKLYVIIDI